MCALYAHSDTLCCLVVNKLLQIVFYLLFEELTVVSRFQNNVAAVSPLIL